MQQSVNNEQRTREPTANGPFFSIIVPVYNVAPYLRECLDSVLAQTFGDWECLCVDDGSTDESGTFLDDYAMKDARFRVFHKKNGGVSSARNLALDNAKGKWVSFLDSDDLWSVTFLLEMVKIIQAQNPDLLRIGYTKFSSRDEIKYSNDFNDEIRIVLGKDGVKEWAARNLPRSGYCWLIIAKNNFLDRFPIGVAFAEDLLFVLRLVSRMNKVVQSAYCGYFYRETNNSATKQKFTSKERVDFLNEFEKIGLIYKDFTPEISSIGVFHFYNWVWNSKDVKNERAIHSVIVRLVQNGIIRIVDFPKYVKPFWWMYKMFRWRWSFKLSYFFAKKFILFRDKYLRR